MRCMAQPETRARIRQLREEDALQLEATSKDGVTVVRMQARELAFAVCEEFQKGMEKLMESGNTMLLIDFETIEFMDSMGIGTLIALRNKAHERGGELGLARIADPVHKVLRITQLHKVFPIYDDLESGVQALRNR
jgi:anti-anti-sigma factor